MVAILVGIMAHRNSKTQKGNKIEYRFKNINF